jgi:hypothetical protein
MVSEGGMGGVYRADDTTEVNARKSGGWSAGILFLPPSNWAGVFNPGDQPPYHLPILTLHCKSQRSWLKVLLSFSHLSW